LESVEHAIEAHAERGQLIARRWHGQPPAGLGGGDCLSFDAHPVDRPQRRAGNDPTGEDAQQDGNRHGQRQLRLERVERAALVVKGDTGQHDLAGRTWHRQDAHRLRAFIAGHGELRRPSGTHVG
jgi:hypothetical protein